MPELVLVALITAIPPTIVALLAWRGVKKVEPLIKDVHQVVIEKKKKL